MISGLFLYFLPQIVSRIFAVMRLNPDLTQTGVKRSGFIEIYLTKQHEFLCFQEYFERLNGGCKLQPPLWLYASDRVSNGVSNRICRALFHA